jgi:thymidylate kinase
VPNGPRFECLEGLQGCGKSTIAPLLAAARGAILVPTVPDFYQSLRREVDWRSNVEARMALYLSALFTATDEIVRHLSSGTSVVVESYFARCLATHRALGAQLAVELPPNLPQPVTYQLLCAEGERQRRLAARNKTTSHWGTRSEDVAQAITDAYANFSMHQVDTTNLRPDQVVDDILATDTQGAGRRADAKPVAAHPHFLPPIPCGAPGALPS